MTLLNQARKFADIAGCFINGDSTELRELREFYKAVIPILEEHEKRQELIRDFNAANKIGQIIAAPDERAERRTLAIAQMAAVLYAATREYPEIALPALNWSVNAAQTILAEVEKRG